MHRAYLGISANLTPEQLTACVSDRAGRAIEPPDESANALGLVLAQSDAQPVPIVPLPTGTLTFLFTDIEGSTQLWEQHHEAMHSALVRHDAILRSAIQAQS